MFFPHMTGIKSKKILALLLAVSCMGATMTGCKKSTGPSYLTADGLIPSVDITTAEDGYYLLKAEDHLAYQGFTAGYIDDNHFWLVESMDAAIPTLTASDQLIVKSKESRPSSFKFIKFIDYGYTVGTSFSIIQDSTDIKSPTVITFGTDRNPASPVGNYIDSRLDSKNSLGTDNVKITEINNKAFKASMLTDSGYLKGLTQNAMYKFTYYEGTYYKDMTIKADSHLFLADTTYNSTSYSEMKEDGNYFIIKLPSSIDSGYYYLENFGLFKYEAPEGGLGGDIKKVIDDNDNSPDEDDDYIDYAVQETESVPEEENADPETTVAETTDTPADETPDDEDTVPSVNDENTDETTSIPADDAGSSDETTTPSSEENKNTADTEAGTPEDETPSNEE